MYYCGNVILRLREMRNLFWKIRIYFCSISGYFHSKTLLTCFSHCLPFEENNHNVWFNHEVWVLRHGMHISICCGKHPVMVMVMQVSETDGVQCILMVPCIVILSCFVNGLPPFWKMWFSLFSLLKSETCFKVQ